MTFPIELFVLFGVSVLCSSIGLYKYVYFMSVGYGLSIAGCGGVLLLLHHDGPWPIRCLCILLVIYGCRLAAYLALRRKGNTSFSRQMESEDSEGAQDMGIKLMLWFSCAALYALMVSPLCYRITGGNHLDTSLWVGGILMALGVILEWAADISKNLQKRKYPGEICRRGLYRFVRCPNYFGELVLWTGVLVCGVTSFQTVGQWIIAGIGYLGIVYVMFNGARRLEIRQNRTYGGDPRYERYVKKVPIIIPLVPLYSVERWKWLAL